LCNDCIDTGRRHFLTRTAIGVAAAGFLAANASISPSFAKTALTPDEALAKLKEGNAKFVKSPELCETDILKQREAVAKGQSPWATILTCADSRVAPELVFGGMNLGELFVCRNAGNMADVATMGTIEYGAEHLGSPLIVVLGHERCGAVSAAVEVAQKGTKLPGSIGPMIDAILPVAKDLMGKEGDLVDNVVHESARRTSVKIATTSEIVKGLIAEGKVKVVYASYDLDTGVVAFLG
jgi:carbonic anhydrase